MAKKFIVTYRTIHKKKRSSRKKAENWRYHAQLLQKCHNNNKVEIATWQHCHVTKKIWFRTLMQMRTEHSHNKRHVTDDPMAKTTINKKVLCIRNGHLNFKKELDSLTKGSRKNSSYKHYELRHVSSLRRPEKQANREDSTHSKPIHLTFFVMITEICSTFNNQTLGTVELQFLTTWKLNIWSDFPI